MLRLHYAPRTRAVRIRWLLEELGLPHELVRGEFLTPADGFAQNTPSGKFPVLEDEGLVLAESGAILEYVVERYAAGRLAPPIGDPLRGAYLQLIHFSEGTAYPPMSPIIFHTRYAQDADERGDLMEVWRGRSRAAFAVAEEHLGDKEWLLGPTFSAADIMFGFTLAVGQAVGVVDERFPGLQRYFGRLAARPAFQRAVVD